MISGLLLFGCCLSQAQSYSWVSEPWDSVKDDGAYRDFRLQCEELVWGIKAPVDVLDRKAIDSLYAERISAYKKNKSADNAFYLLCAMAYFGPNSDAQIALQLQAFLAGARGYRSYEFSRVALAANALYREVPLPKSDLEKRLFDRRKDDPLLMLAAVAGADMVRGYQEEHRRALRFAEKLYEMFPKRREKYRCVLALALEMCWARSGLWAKKPLPDYYDRAMKLIADALSDPQTSKSDRLDMENTRRFMVSIKERVEGGGKGSHFGLTSTGP